MKGFKKGMTRFTSFQRQFWLPHGDWIRAYESLGRNIFLGEVEVPLDTWDWDSEPTWLPLQPRVSSWPAWGDPGPDLPPLPHRAFP